MDVYSGFSKLKKYNNSVITIGSFDGMHKGHLDIINHTNYISKKNNIPSIAITFDPHPQSILKNNYNEFKILMDINQKIDIFKQNDFDYVWIIPFSEDIAQISANIFLKKYLIEYFSPNDIVIGYDHHFGNKREGDHKFLIDNNKKYNYTVHKLNPTKINNITISSTIIRKFIRSNNIKFANKLLGRNFLIKGIVVHGNGVGKKIKFPTANIELPKDNTLIPGDGVYSVLVKVNNDRFIGMCNIGIRPTFYKNGEKNFEVHIITDENLNLYNKEIIIEFQDFIRKEVKYESEAELIDQLYKDRSFCISNSII